MIKFCGYQDQRNGEPLPMFNVFEEGHKSYGSTVSLTLLRSYGFNVPAYPTYNGEIFTDARLVHAAPDLLAACKAVLQDHLGREYGEQLARAIDKAEGRQ